MASVAGERDVVVEAGSGDFRHVPGVQEEQEVLDVVANVGDGRNDEAVVLRGWVRVRDEDSLGRVAEVVAAPGHRLSGLL